ncbi:MAG: glycosyltransferase [Candidatus Diapherotrites archaeon]|nr:glycosyltransferase [Candidatus Diapherotrites archaeon]
MARKPVVSVIIPTLNEAKFIERCISSFQTQSVPRHDFEIIVSDSSSNDNTAEIARKIADRVVVCERMSATHGRNEGAKLASGKFLVFVDADTVVGKHFIEGVVWALEKGIAATGPIFALEKDSLRMRLFLQYWSFQSLVSTAIGFPIFPGFNFAVRRNVFEKAGGFQEKRTGEDIDLSLRLARLGKTVFSENMVVFTSTRRLKEQGIIKYAFNGFTYIFFGKSVPWHEYRKDFVPRGERR